MVVSIYPLIDARLLLPQKFEPCDMFTSVFTSRVIGLGIVFVPFQTVEL